MDKIKYTYVIVPIANIDLINFSQVIEERESLRINNDGTFFIVKFLGDTPIDLLKYNKYNGEDLKLIINNQENGWINTEI